jgi:hypothetical protein
MLCFRLLYESEPASVLLDTVQAVEQGQGNSCLHAISPTSFSEIPTAPFAYWSVAPARKLFKQLPPFEGSGRTVKQGLATADDFRFVRTSWEAWQVDYDATQVWFPFAKGGSFAPFYARMSMMVNWQKSGSEIRFYGDPTGKKPKSRPQGVDYYMLPGMTWPLRGIIFSAQAVPRNSVFSIAGKLATSANEKELPALMCLFNSKPFDYLIRFFAGKVGGVQYEVGLIGNIPVFDLSKGAVKMKGKFEKAWSTKRRTDTATLTSHAFHAPALAPGRKPKPTR